MALAFLFSTCRIPPPLTLTSALHHLYRHHTQAPLFCLFLLHNLFKSLNVLISSGCSWFNPSSSSSLSLPGGSQLLRKSSDFSRIDQIGVSIELCTIPVIYSIHHDFISCIKYMEFGTMLLLTCIRWQLMMIHIKHLVRTLPFK